MNSKRKGRRRESYAPEVVNEWLLSRGLPLPTYELRFCPTRKWRFDLAWPQHKVALEVQGGIWGYGRHSRGAALLKEWEKLNAAAVLGWRILYCQPCDLCLETTAGLLKSVLKQ